MGLKLRLRGDRQTANRGHVLFHNKGREAIKVENEVLGAGVNVADNGVHASKLRILLHDEHFLGERLGLRPDLEAGKRCSVMFRLFQQLVLDELNNHGCVWSASDHPPSMVAPTHGNAIFNTTRDNNVRNFSLGVDELPIKT
jgi:hypothetical protein